MILSLNQIYLATIRSIYAARDAGDFDRADLLDAYSYKLAILGAAS